MSSFAQTQGLGVTSGDWAGARNSAQRWVSRPRLLGPGPRKGVPQLDRTRGFSPMGMPPPHPYTQLRVDTTSLTLSWSRGGQGGGPGQLEAPFPGSGWGTQAGELPPQLGPGGTSMLLPGVGDASGGLLGPRDAFHQEE